MKESITPDAALMEKILAFSQNVRTLHSEDDLLLFFLTTVYQESAGYLVIEEDDQKEIIKLHEEKVLSCPDRTEPEAMHPLITFDGCTLYTAPENLLQPRILVENMISIFLEARERIRCQEKAAHEEARATIAEEKNRLLHSIAHDLRVPLTGIIGLSELIQSMDDVESIRPLASDISLDARRLHELLENILSLTRLESKKLELHTSIESLSEVIDEAVSSLLHRSGMTQEIIVNTPDDIILASIDNRLIFQALSNLLHNAVQHSPENGTIEITLTCPDDMAVIEIVDQGDGIAPENLERIFDAFFTTRLGNSSKGKGTGLGLPISRQIAQAHGGDIEAHNREDGPGARFTLLLPAKRIKA